MLLFWYLHWLSAVMSLLAYFHLGSLQTTSAVSLISSEPIFAKTNWWSKQLNALLKSRNLLMIVFTSLMLLIIFSTKSEQWWWIFQLGNHVFQLKSCLLVDDLEPSEYNFLHDFRNCQHKALFIFLFIY